MDIVNPGSYPKPLIVNIHRENAKNSDIPTFTIISTTSNTRNETNIVDITLGNEHPPPHPPSQPPPSKQLDTRHHMITQYKSVLIPPKCYITAPHISRHIKTK